uniref:Uncharacterized protein n=1 Tax=Arundo donax TaxID=35708 RepID=A0A0A8Y401_ARUDO
MTVNNPHQVYMKNIPPTSFLKQFTILPQLDGVVSATTNSSHFKYSFTV